MTNEKLLNVGDVAIHVPRYGEKPVTVNVDKVTKAGWVKIPNNNNFFKVSNRLTGEYTAKSSYSYDRLFLFSDEKMAELQAAADEVAKRKAEKNAETLRREQEANNERVSQFVEIEKLCNSVLPVNSRRTLPDGSRLVTMTCPVNPKFGKQFEIIIVRMTESKEYNFRTDSYEPQVEAFVTYCNDRKQSFPSCSSYKYATDNDALWDTLRRRYNDSY